MTSTEGIFEGAAKARGVPKVALCTACTPVRAKRESVEKSFIGKYFFLKKLCFLSGAIHTLFTLNYQGWSILGELHAT